MFIARERRFGLALRVNGHILTPVRSLQFKNDATNFCGLLSGTNARITLARESANYGPSPASFFHRKLWKIDPLCVIPDILPCVNYLSYLHRIPLPRLFPGTRELIDHWSVAGQFPREPENRLYARSTENPPCFRRR